MVQKGLIKYIWQDNTIKGNKYQSIAKKMCE
jgi:hypothetical protein